MKRGLAGVFSIAAAGVLAWGAPGSAATLDERVEALEKAAGFEFGAVAYGNYQYNFNDPDSGLNQVRSLDQEHNNFTFDLFQLQVGKKFGEEVAFASKLDFGKTARRIASDWDGDGLLSDSEETNDFEVQEAYLTYTPEWAGGVSLKAGKFVTLLGSEVIEATANMNFTRSILFGFAIPFTHTGLLFTVPVGETVSVMGGVVNGWDNVVDNNDGKTFLGGVALTPAEFLSLGAYGTFGPEKSDTNDDPRGIIDLVSTLTFDPFILSLNFDYGSEGGVFEDGGDATWVGFSGIVGANFSVDDGPPFAIYARGEVFDDQDGFRTGTEQQLTEFTLTGKYFLTENLTFWAEFRSDFSDEDVFQEEGTITVITDPLTGATEDIAQVTDSQPTALVALSLTF